MHVLDSFPHGFIGIHNSLLPKYRGYSPLVWQIVNGEDNVGFSVFSLAPGMDDRDVWFQESIPIEQDEFIDSVLHRLQGTIEQSFGILYPKIINETIKPWVQTNSTKSCCGIRIPSGGLVD